jgi:hypothetical protein
MDRPVVPDVFSDQFSVAIQPYGAVLAFMRAEPVIEGVAATGPPVELVAKVRLTPEHLKIATFMLWRQVMAVEKELGVSFPVPATALAQGSVKPDDFAGFWGQVNEPIEQDAEAGGGAGESSADGAGSPAGETSTGAGASTPA